MFKNRESKLNVKLLSHTGDPVEVINVAGKLCYSAASIEELDTKVKSSENPENFVEKLMSLGHESPLEHVSFTFGIEGVSRSLTHQLVRHRIASYSQQSQRYVREKGFDYVVPNDIKRCEILRKRFECFMEENQRQYDFFVQELEFEYLTRTDEQNGLIKLFSSVSEYKEAYSMITDLIVSKIKEKKSDILALDHKDKMDILFKIFEKYPFLERTLSKRAIENARYVLPNACETKIVVTMNLRSLINFCKHRCCRRAQEEIRELANEMIKEVSKISPDIANFLGAPCMFGRCPEGEMTCGNPFRKNKK
ncbi:FAD-dependent thymidylate synthase [Clostridium perfringens]